jgi:hypothetical protein
MNHLQTAAHTIIDYVYGWLYIPFYSFYSHQIPSIPLCFLLDPSTYVGAPNSHPSSQAPQPATATRDSVAARSRKRFACASAQRRIFIGRYVW